MQILVISDTHGAYANLRAVYQDHLSADMIIHCGDGQYDTARLMAEFPEAAAKLIRVRGNCDHSTDIPLLQAVELPYGHKALVTHGHRYMNADFPQTLLAVAQNLGADIVLFGHIHQRVDTVADGIRLFNPGSAAQPRDGKPASFGLVDILESGILTSHGNVRL